MLWALLDDPRGHLAPLDDHEQDCDSQSTSSTVQMFCCGTWSLSTSAHGVIVPGSRHWPSFSLLVCSFMNQVLAQLDLLRYWKETTACRNVPPPRADSSMHPPALGAAINVPTQNQADCAKVKVEGPVVVTSVVEQPMWRTSCVTHMSSMSCPSLLQTAVGYSAVRRFIPHGTLHFFTGVQRVRAPAYGMVCSHSSVAVSGHGPAVRRELSRAMGLHPLSQWSARSPRLWTVQQHTIWPEERG